MLPGRYQELDLFIKVLRLLCPNLTDASSKDKSHFDEVISHSHPISIGIFLKSYGYLSYGQQKMPNEEKELIIKLLKPRDSISSRFIASLSTLQELSHGLDLILFLSRGREC